MTTLYDFTVNDIHGKSRSEEHTSELQSRFDLVCRLLLEKKKNDATHNLIFRSPSWNKMMSVIADLPNLTTGAMFFRFYHIKHHYHQIYYEYDYNLAYHCD